jgi:hypothetical protein
MTLAAMLARHPDELAADLMEVYGVAWCDVETGRYPVSFVAQLATQLPPHSRVLTAENPDGAWKLEHVLLAAINNAFNSYAWGVGGKKGRKPKAIGPSYMTGKKAGRKIEAQTMNKDELDEKLAWFAQMAAAGKTKAKGGLNGD